MIHQGDVLRTVTPFTQVAADVFADSTPRNAARRLRRFIAGDPELLARLTDVGYSCRRTWLSPRQLRVLEEYL